MLWFQVLAEPSRRVLGKKLHRWDITSCRRWVLQVACRPVAARPHILLECASGREKRWQGRGSQIHEVSGTPFCISTFQFRKEKNNFFNCSKNLCIWINVTLADLLTKITNVGWSFLTSEDHINSEENIVSYDFHC